ncbi:hypothetical protein [Nereida sp. MMG025]|uniref:hypothetical protein n=1 Tax=Nereida sp. MMG025 TaxID=2909981 RepID=UPI001F409826|nr:hypothetical protein [Nereida sp. MMG025]MCF6443556.1 hypothetical protein [Nereida sp. MMG025]
MIPYPLVLLIGFLGGGVAGAVTAKLRKGKRNDMIHYFFVWGIIGLIVTMFYLVLSAR